MQLYTGCSGWSYSAWSGHFYPRALESSDYLQYYSKVFDFVEIDSTFYKTPADRFVTIRWNKLTPDNFKFAAKIPRIVTHENRLGTGSAPDLERFFDVMKPLKEKTLALLIQLPPSLAAKEGFKKLEKLMPLLDKEFRYAIEFRHKSWFEKDVYGLLSDYKICLAWSVLDVIHTPPEVTTDFIYLRFVGDRTIDEAEFGKVRYDKSKEMIVWASKVKNIQKHMNFGIVAANNHYAGFGPGTANQFRKMLGLKEVVWEEKKQATLD